MQPLPIFDTALRALTFRLSREQLLALDRRHLGFGLLSTWLVGMGRYWDDPGAKLLQHLGVGSLVYVFVLAAMLWVVIKPLGAPDFSYRRILTFVTLTSPPAMLYAIPVERFLSLQAARTANVWFLTVVATWRVLLFVFVVRRLGQLNWLRTLVGCLLPLTFIVAALSALNLERAVFAIMGGLRDGTANDGAYKAVLTLTLLASLTFIPLVISWLALSFTHWRNSLRRDTDPPPPPVEP